MPRENEVIEPDDDELIATINENNTSRITIEFDVDCNELGVPINAISVDDCLSLPTLGDINAVIRDGPDFSSILAYLEHGTLPEDIAKARRIVVESHDYVIKDGTLYHLFVPRTKRLDRAMATISQICVPKQIREIVARELHNNNGHLGVDRLYSTVKCRYYWPGQYKYLHDYVITCLDCQRCKRPIHRGKTPVGELPITNPCTRFNVDIHGSYPLSGDGYRFVLAFICCTSGWPELIAVRDTSAEAVVQAIHDHIVCRYGLCRSLTLQSDCGSAFISKLTKLYCQMFGVKQSFSSPYRPQANS